MELGEESLKYAHPQRTVCLNVRRLLNYVTYVRLDRDLKSSSIVAEAVQGVGPLHSSNSTNLQTSCASFRRRLATRLLV